MTDNTTEQRMDLLPPVQEIKPCPYVNGFSSDNSEVEFMMRDYGAHSDLVVFEQGKPARCFRMAAQQSRPQMSELTENEAVEIMQDAANFEAKRTGKSTTAKCWQMRAAYRALLAHKK